MNRRGFLAGLATTAFLLVSDLKPPNITLTAEETKHRAEELLSYFREKAHKHWNYLGGPGTRGRPEVQFFTNEDDWNLLKQSLSGPFIEGGTEYHVGERAIFKYPEIEEPHFLVFGAPLFIGVPGAEPTYKVSRA